MYSIIHIGNTPLPSYLFVISLVYCICIYWIYKRSQKLGLNPHIAMDLALLIMFTGLVGARLFHVVYEAPQFYQEHPIEILKLWKGGFVFYGGALFAFICSIIFLKSKSIPLGLWLDAFAPVAALGYGLGRIGCFLAGCCFGKYCSLPWGVIYPAGVDAPAHVPLHPAPLYATFYELIVVGIILILEKNRKRFHLLQASGSLFYLWLIFHGLGRILNEAFRDDLRGPQPWGHSISSWISVVLIASGLLYFMGRKAR